MALPETAPWLAEFVNEIVAFPGWRFDDQADALAQLLRHGAPAEQATSYSGPMLFSNGEWIGKGAFGGRGSGTADPWVP